MRSPGPGPSTGEKRSSGSISRLTATAVTLTHSGLSPKAGPGGGDRAGWHSHLEGIADAVEVRKTSWETIIARRDGIAPRYPALPA